MLRVTSTHGELKYWRMTSARAPPAAASHKKAAQSAGSIHRRFEVISIVTNTQISTPAAASRKAL
jgi:hypothetical protein